MRHHLERRRPSILLVAAAAAVAVAALTSGPSQADEPWQATHEQRRQKLREMDASQKERLDRQAERFHGLPPAEKQKVRSIHDELSRAPDGPQLYAVLQRYCEWLKTLDAAERADLAALPPEERIGRIRQIMKNQEEQRFRRLAKLSYEDTRAVLDWLDEMVQPHEDELLQLLSPGAQEFIAKWKDERARRKMIVSSLFRENKKDELRETIQPSSEDLARLLARLSPETQEEFKKLGELQKQQDLVRTWIWWAVFRQSYRPVSDAELHKFFANLPTEKQAELERLPREEMHHELRKLYYASRPRGPDWGASGEGGPGRSHFRGPFRDGGGSHFDRPDSEERRQFGKAPE